MANAKRARPSKDEANGSVLQRAKRTNSSLSQLLSSQNHPVGQSENFEEDEGFIFKRNKQRRGKSVKSQKERKPVKNAKKAPKAPKTENLLIDEMDKIAESTPERKLRNGKKSKPFNFTKKPTLEPQTLSPPISSSPVKKEYEEHHESIQVILPVSDSPVNRRNKEFRGDRRTSLGNRGKRVSSIGNGFVAVPHDDVPVEEFYKHFDQSMPEPHRMRQLLIWCGKRVLSKEKRPKKKNLTAVNIAKVIKQELIKDLSMGKLNTSWWNREEVKKEIKLVPNAQNITNFQNLKMFEKRLADLKQEEQMWLELQKEDEPLKTVVEPEEQDEPSTLAEITSKSQSAIEQVNEKLEKSVDELSLFSHNLDASSRCIERYSQEKIKTVTSIFQKESLSTRDLLRGISKMDAP